MAVKTDNSFESRFNLVGFNPEDPDNYHPNFKGRPLNGEIDPTSVHEYMDEADSRDDDAVEISDFKIPRVGNKENLKGLENKLETIYFEYGFYPKTSRELTHVWELRKYRDAPGGAAKYLNVVLQHQQRDDVSTNDPEAAVRKLANSWKGYRQEAKGDKSAVVLLGQFASDNPQLSTDQLLSKDLLLDPGFNRAAQVIQLNTSLDAIANSEETSKFPYRIVSDQESIKVLDRKVLTEKIWQTSMAAEARRVYWQSVLHQSYTHLLARPIIRDAIIIPEK